MNRPKNPLNSTSNNTLKLLNNSTSLANINGNDDKVIVCHTLLEIFNGDRSKLVVLKLKNTHNC